MTDRKKTSSTYYCDFCGKPIDGLPFICKFCGGKFCSKHRLPEEHNCQGLKEYKEKIAKGEKPWFKEKWHKEKERDESYFSTTSSNVPFTMPYKQKNKKMILLIIGISILLAIIFLQLYFIYHMQQNIDRLEMENIILKQGNENLRNEVEKLNESYYLVKNEINSVIEKINYYENELEESMKWFKDNSILNNDILKEKRIGSTLKDNCLKKYKLDNKCLIRAGCFELVNAEKFDFDYKTDIETTNEEDKLQSLEEFIENKGGDCEDYSLFFKAEYNYLLEECMKSDYSIEIESWIQAEPWMEYWLDNGRRWYLDGATRIVLDKGYIYPNVVCGDMYDPNEDNISGHCVLAFTRNKIETKNDIIEELSEAPLVEPQSGEYIGKINHNSSQVYLLTNNNYDDENIESYIYEVITDKDLFLFSFKYHEWLSYSIFRNDLGSMKKKLLKML